MGLKHEMIAQDLAEKIKHQQFLPGDFLPSEKQLCELYGTSRETTRKALNHLAELGLIQKLKGKGSLVLDIQKYTFPISGITSFQELNDSLGLHAQTKVLQQKTGAAPKYFGQTPIEAKKAIFIERLRIIDQQPAVLDQDYLLDPPITVLPKDVAQHSLYAYLENELGLEIDYATKEITVEQVEPAIAEKLALKANEPAVVVRSLSYLADTTPFQLTTSYHRPDKFKFIDFARRKKLNH
ncbi:trehalose operon transcriptional repressor [Ligilactobacillus apodemi DSM 16634 = JCM 16172]|uniref:Trehalose operon repressor n=2 Tax=Ligilactobacillus TaxID=2767887 RepID=A0A0R1U0R0_9LACO|nr:trehalose operon transcriptional repressor [Ligilactobacillus apodemi DSM 16634 = JCM 16172]